MKQKLPRAILALLSFILICQYTLAQEEEEETLYFEENHVCFKCHGQTYFYYYNDWLGREIKERMNPFYVIDSAEFYQANHRSFLCTDCHSTEYENFPHPNELRFEPMLGCMICHEGDDTFADYNFEGINEEFHESVHSTKHSEEFTCWMCHDPHSYKINARTQLPITDIITYDNDICLSCHANISKYQLLTQGENPNIIVTHDWLPNQTAHFRHVRCIECHAEYNEDILVAHKVRPKEEAVKLCVECHSRNSILMGSLYKYQAKERRNKLGFLNAAILSEGYVIGANPNIVLDVGSLAIFAVVIAVLLAHFILWRTTRKN